MAIASYEEVLLGSTRISVGVTDDVPPQRVLLTSATVESGGGGAVTIADAADVTQGGKSNAPATSADTTSWSIIALLKGLLANLGFSGDGIATVGSTGTLAAKLRRVTQGLEDLKTLIVLAASENHIGSVSRVSVIPSASAFTLSTSIYAASNVLSDTLALTNVFRNNDDTGILLSLTLNDKDDQGQPIDVYVMDANKSLGTKNSAPSISDSDADSIIGIVSVPASAWKDLGGTRVAHIDNINIPVKAASGTKTLYVSLVLASTATTPTYSTNGITIRPGIQN